MYVLSVKQQFFQKLKQCISETQHIDLSMNVCEKYEAININKHDTFMKLIYCTQSVKELGCFPTLTDLKLTSTVCRDVDSFGNFNGSITNEVSADPCHSYPGGVPSGISFYVNSGGRSGKSGVSAIADASVEGSSFGSNTRHRVISSNMN